MKKVFNLVLAATAILAAAASCTKQGTPLSYEGSTVLEFTADGGTKVITVKSEAEIKLTPGAKWIKATNDKNDITVSISAVPDESSRHGELTVSNGVDTPIVFDIRQEGGKFTFAPEAEYTLPLAGGSIEIPYETNYEFTITAKDSWLTAEKASGKVVLTAAAASKSRETKVTYEAGSNAGEFTVKQYDPVQISVKAELKDYSAAYTKKNTVSYTIKGVGVTSCAFTVVTEDVFAANNEAAWLALLKADAADPDFALDDSELTEVNSAEGYSNGASNKKDNTKYYVIVYASNGSDEKVVSDSVTTEVESDPIMHKYSDDEIYLFESKSAMYGTYKFYADGTYKASKYTAFDRKSTKFGFGTVTVTLSDGGQTTSSTGGTIELVKVSGFYEPFASTIVAAGGTEFVAEDLYWVAVDSGKGWILYPDYGGLVNKGTTESPDYKFYELIATGDGYLHIPQYYPLAGGVAENGTIAFVDTGALDEEFRGFDSWCVCSITMSGNTITDITGQYLGLDSWIFVPQVAPTQISSKYAISTKCYSVFAAKASRNIRNFASSKTEKVSRNIKAVK